MGEHRSHRNSSWPSTAAVRPLQSLGSSGPLTLGGGPSGRGWHSEKQASHLSGLPLLPFLLAISKASSEAPSKAMLMLSGQPFHSGPLSIASGRVADTGY